MLASVIVAVFVAAQAGAQDARGALPYRMYRNQTATVLQKSASPRDWAIASMMSEANPLDGSVSHAHAVLLRKAAEAAPADPLVQWMWANADVRAPDCGTPVSCGARAGALAKLEPDNAAAWLPVLYGDVAAKDAGAIDATLAHMAAAKRFDTHVVEAARTWQEVYRRFPPPDLNAVKGFAPEGMSVSRAALATGEILQTMGSDVLGLTASCSRGRNPQAPPTRFAHCAQVGRLMLQDATTLGARWIGFIVLRASGEARPADVPAIRTVVWQQTQFGKVAEHWDAAAEEAYVADIAKGDNEVEAARKRLQHAGVALEPAAAWQWTRDGKPVDLLHDPSVK